MNYLLPWEENVCIEPKKNSKNRIEFGKGNFMNDMVNVLNEKNLENTTSKKNWTKICPQCGNEMIYTTNQAYNKSIRLNRYCRSCKRMEKSYAGKKFGKLTIEKQYRGTRSNGSKLTCVDCTCECGNILRGAYLQNIKHQTGCRKCQRRGVTKKPYGEASFNALYRRYVNGTKLRNYDFLLTKNEFRELTKQRCFYCGTVPSEIFKSRRCNGEYIYNGVDRKDNTNGYFLGNSVACCTFCNLTKTDTDFNKFIKWIRAVHENTKHIVLEEQA